MWMIVRTGLSTFPLWLSGAPARGFHIQRSCSRSWRVLFHGARDLWGQWARPSWSSRLACYIHFWGLEIPFPNTWALSRAMWVSFLSQHPKGRLCGWYTAQRPDGVQGTAALGLVRAPGGLLQCGWNQAWKERTDNSQLSSHHRMQV